MASPNPSPYPQPRRSRQCWRSALPDLQGARVRLRPLADSDAPSIAAALSVPEVGAHLSGVPRTIEGVRTFIAWVERERAAGRYVCFGVVLHGSTQVSGLFQIWPVEPNFRTAEWGFLLSRNLWGTGMFEECAKLVIDFAIGQMGTRRLEARSARDNVRGNAALRKLGAVQEGVLRSCFECDGEYRDHLLWSILATEWMDRPARPTSAVAAGPGRGARSG